MKNVNLKKPAALAASAALTLSLAACGGGSSGTPAPAVSPAGEDAPVYTVAVVKQMDHASLDEIADAIAARLDEIAAENGITIQYEVTSGQGDQTVLRQLADQAIADGVDTIIPIATIAAQVAAVSAEESQTPVVFAAISYPETAELTGIDYVTGTSDALDTNLILDMMLAQNPDTPRWACSTPCPSPTPRCPSPRPRNIWTARASPMRRPPPTPTTRSSPPPAPSSPTGWTRCSPPPTTSS